MKLTRVHLLKVICFNSALLRALYHSDLAHLHMCWWLSKGNRCKRQNVFTRRMFVIDELCIKGTVRSKTITKSLIWLQMQAFAPTAHNHRREWISVLMKDGVNLKKPNGLNSSALPAKEVISEKKRQTGHRIITPQLAKCSKSLNTQLPTIILLKNEAFLFLANNLAPYSSFWFFLQFPPVCVCVDSHSFVHSDDGWTVSVKQFMSYMPIYARTSLFFLMWHIKKTTKTLHLLKGHTPFQESNSMKALSDWQV